MKRVGELKRAANAGVKSVLFSFRIIFIAAYIFSKLTRCYFIIINRIVDESGSAT